MATEFVVRWCDRIPKDDCGDDDHDRAHYVHRVFPSRQDALLFAQEAAKDAVYGYSSISEHRRVSARYARLASLEDDAPVWSDRLGQWWESVGESVEVSA